MNEEVVTIPISSGLSQPQYLFYFDSMGSLNTVFFNRDFIGHFEQI